jgi:hypothetical protein
VQSKHALAPKSPSDADYRLPDHESLVHDSISFSRSNLGSSMSVITVCQKRSLDTLCHDPKWWGGEGKGVGRD